MPSLVNDPGKTPEGEKLIERDLYYSWTMLFQIYSVCLKKRTTTEIIEPENTSKTMPGQQTNLRTDMPWKLCLYGTVRILLYGSTESVWTCPYNCTKLSVRNCTELFRTDVRNCPYTIRTGTDRKSVSSRKTCRFLKFMQKLVSSRKTCRKLFDLLPLISEKLFLISVPYFSLSANHFLMSRNNLLFLSHHKSFSQWFSVMPFPMNEVFNDPSWLKTLTTH